MAFHFLPQIGVNEGSLFQKREKQSMKKYFAMAAALALVAPASYAQDTSISPVWHYLITHDSSPLPILEQDEPTPNETWDGTDVYDSYGGLKRYDENRLLLGVRENGINETEDGHDADLAAQFPDRSLVWINPADGSPMGVALEVGLEPVTLSDSFLDAGGSTIDYYFNFGVSEDGVIYVGYKNTVLRYAPDGNGGFTGPTVAYEHADDGSDLWSAWRWEVFRVMGSGSDTVIAAGGKTWRPNQFLHFLVTDDGETFTKQGDTVGFRGGFSQPYIDPFSEDGWLVIGGNFPGGASGFGSDIRREFGGADYTGFESDPLFTFTAPEVDTENQNFLDSYIGWFLSGYDVNPDLPYFVVYSTPSWDTKDPGTAGSLGFGDNPTETPYLPGWLALHDLETGEYLEGSAFQLAVTEGDELDGDTTDSEQPVSRWHGTLGDVELNTLGEGAELLWYGGIYGYGRFTIGDTNVNTWSIY